MKAVIILISVISCTPTSARIGPAGRIFPRDFLFGTSSAAYQIEGAWNKDGKGESIWDRFVHRNPPPTKDGSTGDIANDAYHKYKGDVKLLRELGVNCYRFSISWTRLLPTGFSNYINPPGVQYYNNVIDELIKYNIEPIVTLYHFDLPQSLQDLGGFASPLIEGWFEDYARVVFGLYGDRVKKWITINEPRETCSEAYGTATSAPGLNFSGFADYLCAKHVLLSHASAYHLYDREFRASQGGEVGIAFSASRYEPASDSVEDEVATELKRQSELTMYVHPVFSEEGGFPAELSLRIAQKSAEQGYTFSRLPFFSDEEKTFVQGTADFLGVNHYCSFLISASRNLAENPPIPSLADDVNVGIIIPDDWPRSALNYMARSPDSLFHVLSHLNSSYKNITYYVTENGWAADEGFEDDKIANYRANLEGVLDSLDAGIRVKGFMAWTLMDNHEWINGFSVKFGLYLVDRNDSELARIPRGSAFVYKEIIKTRQIDHKYYPTTQEMIIDANQVK